MGKIPNPAPPKDIEGRFAALRSEFPGWDIGPSDMPSTPYRAVREGGDEKAIVLASGSYDGLWGLLSQQDAADCERALLAVGKALAERGATVIEHGVSLVTRTRAGVARSVGAVRGRIVWDSGLDLGPLTAVDEVAVKIARLLGLELHPQLAALARRMGVRGYKVDIAPPEVTVATAVGVSPPRAVRVTCEARPPTATVSGSGRTGATRSPKPTTSPVRRSNSSGYWPGHEPGTAKWSGDPRCPGRRPLAAGPEPARVRRGRGLAQYRDPRHRDERSGMRLPRWMPWIEGLLEGSPAITGVKTFADAGITDPRYGHVITLRTGAQALLQWVRTSPPTGDQSEEVVVTGEPPATQTLPELPASGRTPLRLIEQHLAALIANGANPEIRAVERTSTRDDVDPRRPCCVVVRMHSGADIVALFRNLAPAGANLNSGDEFQQREEV